MGGVHPLDWAILLLYLAVTVWAGFKFTHRAGKSLDEFFLSGRSLPWWLTGTSMVATSFSCDTPLLVSGWVRDYGIWKNWAWWCFAISGCLQVFLFARWWRRAEVMTKAELTELRYGDRGARLLRGTLGAFHALVTNSVIMAWVLLAAAKISGVLFSVGKLEAVVLASLVALAYSVSSGMWGVVFTDFPQFILAMTGAITLFCVVWHEVGGVEAVTAATASGKLAPDTLRFFPGSGPGGLFDASFWTVSLTAAVVYLGVSWWATESVDGASAAVQRIAASKNEREGVLAILWFNVAHYALRPWFWVAAGLASLLLLPSRTLTAPADGVVRAVDERGIELAANGDAPSRLALDDGSGWRLTPQVEAGARVSAGQTLAASDSEEAYVVLLKRYLPVGLFGLVMASLLAAFMSTIETHINLAASFFVNDVYRRFLRRDSQSGHYILVARLASAAALAIAGLVALQTKSIRDLFLLFLSLLGGVGPVYLLRWVWWRVRASTEITAIAASAASTVVLSWLATPRADGSLPVTWHLGPLSPDGALAPEGRLLLVVGVSLVLALASLALTRAPDPATLVRFYRKVRPIGWWGPVRELAGSGPETRELTPALVGSLGGLLLTYGLTLGGGYLLLQHWIPLALAALAAALGAGLVVWSLRRLCPVAPATPSGRS